jgi:allantoate deiminase
MPPRLMTATIPTSDAIRQQAQRVIARCRKLATFSEEPGRTVRTFLSPPMRNCHREIAGWLEPLKAETNIDAVGNFRALYSGSNPHAPRLLIGSHLDTVPDAGAFDGVLGVALGVALLEMLKGGHLPFAIELVGFSEEEGVRFETPFIGSRALVGRLNDKLLEKTDENGISVRDAIEKFGLNSGEISAARLNDDALAYIEFHIEQGPVLEDLGLPLGVVEAIAGQSRMELTFVGRANHAGTTPMHLRHDALAAAAEWTVAVEHEGRSLPGMVATVGSIKATPGAINVIAVEAEVSLDVRHVSDEVRVAAVERLVRLADEIAGRRGLSVRRRSIASQAAVRMDRDLTIQVEDAVKKAGCKPHRMVSGAGHDAMILAERIPAAMIFVRTPGGISHSPAEDVNVEDVEKALAAGVNLLHLLASSHRLSKRRTARA